MTTNKRSYLTLVLLCLGYFIDFYDLTIMSVSYNELIKEQFGITSLTKIQQTYLLISNFQTAGIFIGAIIFGTLGDKVGRANAIKYSILLYSITTILAAYTTSLPVFIALRLLAYVGLATEFSTSTVLILESFQVRSATWSSAFLYSSGVLGGIFATLIGIFSWKGMFLFGGIAGLFLFIARAKIIESNVYSQSKAKLDKSKFGNLSILLTQQSHLLSLIKYLLVILPYYAIITMMFIFPNFIVKSYSIAEATKILLVGFFIGNIIGSLLSAVINNYFKNYKVFIRFMLFGFLGLMLIFPLVPEKLLIFYSIGLGIVGGGYPISWAQNMGREFPINVRSLASNLLFGLGRGSSIVFNLLITYWIGANTFKDKAPVVVVVVFVLASISLLLIKNNYSSRPLFTDNGGNQNA